MYIIIIIIITTTYNIKQVQDSDFEAALDGHQSLPGQISFP